MIGWMVRFLARKAPQFFRRSRYKGVKVVERMSDVPSKLGGSIFLVERAGNKQWAVLECPCRTGHRLTITLREGDDPHWVANQRDKNISLHPSLWLTEECSSHFWIRDNKVTWV